MRIMSWNINGGVPLTSRSPLAYAAREDLTAFTDHVRRLEPDVLCLQEAHRNASRSQAGEIAEELGYEHVFEAAASDSHIDPTYELANAVLSKRPFKRARAVMLPRPDFPLRLPRLPNGEEAAIHDKYLQVVELEPFVLANIHTLPLNILGAAYDSPDGMAFSRAIQQVLLDELRSPLVFCGDFNFWRIRDLYPRLFREFGLVDALPAIPSRPGNDDRTDYVLYASSTFELLEGRITPFLSDHYPCHADLGTRAADPGKAQEREG